MLPCAIVVLDYVVGLLYDVDGMMTDFQMEYAATSPVEARKLFRNTWNQDSAQVQISSLYR